MATELRPGLFTEMFAGLAVEAEARARVALNLAALEVEKQAKLNASNGEHPPRTKTPASPGSGPARISGTLVRSITHTEADSYGIGWQVRIGPSPGLFPYYSTRTSSDKYARYLEVTGVRNGSKYPFLAPALDTVGHLRLHAIFEAAFVGWGITIG